MLFRSNYEHIMNVCNKYDKILLEEIKKTDNVFSSHPAKKKNLFVANSLKIKDEPTNGTFKCKLLMKNNFYYKDGVGNLHLLSHSEIKSYFNEKKKTTPGKIKIKVNDAYIDVELSSIISIKNNINTDVFYREIDEINENYPIEKCTKDELNKY